MALVSLGNGLTCSMMNNARTASAVQSGGTVPGTGDYLGYDGSGRMIVKRYLPASGTNVAVVGYTTSYDASSNKKYEQQLHGDASRSSLYPSLQVVAACAYDVLGRRVRKAVTNGGVTGTVANPTYRYVYDGQQIVEKQNDANIPTRQFVWGQYIDELVQLRFTRRRSRV